MEQENDPTQANTRLALGEEIHKLSLTTVYKYFGLLSLHLIEMNLIQNTSKSGQNLAHG